MNNARKMIGLITVIFGVIIILKPNFLAWLVGIYLILTGLLNWVVS